MIVEVKTEEETINVEVRFSSRNFKQQLWLKEYQARKIAFTNVYRRRGQESEIQQLTTVLVQPTIDKIVEVGPKELNRC